MTIRLKGLYAITDSRLIKEGRLIGSVKQAILGGAHLIQYRNKTDLADVRIKEASALLKLCNQYAIPLIINNDVDLARQIGAHGVHLGKEDMRADEARDVLGSQAIIGVSCYNCLDLALNAQRQGADYVAFGSFFPSATKPHAVKANVDLIIQAKQNLHVPVCGIGGITVDNAHVLIDAGIDMLAVIHGVFANSDIRTTAEQGSSEDNLPPGTRWEEIPFNWTCPECGATKDDFEMVEIE